jgi:hypothetical protein
VDTEIALAVEIAELSALAWEALCDGRDDRAEEINRAAIAAREALAACEG